jgi:hypothetical protein
MNKNLSQIILDICSKEFIPNEDMPNKEYLDSYLLFLTRKVSSYRQTSESLKFSIMERSKARDMEQNCIGLINGIKFGIAFLDSKSINLMELSNKQVDEEIGAGV